MAADEGRHERRPNIDLEKIGIRLGDTLELVGREGVSCIVVGLQPPLVVHDGAVKSLSAACADAYGFRYSPGRSWAYNGETLRDRRRRFAAYHAVGQCR